VSLALRCDPDRAKALAGFDPIAIGIPSVADLEACLYTVDGES
jgi:hypothetical protein